MHHVYFEQELLDLRAELDHHPVLAATLRLQPVQDIYIHICEIGSHLGVQVDGTFTKDEILKLCEMFTKLLYLERTGII